jgi:hypothetical protein
VAIDDQGDDTRLDNAGSFSSPAGARCDCSRTFPRSSDLDGALGTEQTPRDLDSIADLQKFPDLLSARGSSVDGIARILHGNLIRFLRTAWS